MYRVHNGSDVGNIATALLYRIKVNAITNWLIKLKKKEETFSYGWYVELFECSICI